MTMPSTINAADFPSNVADGNLASRWSTGTNQVAGQYFQVDFGGKVALTQVVLDSSNNALDYPRGYVMGLSDNGTSFTTVAMGSPTTPIVTAAFGTAQGRYLRITQTASSNENWWDIGELRLSCTVLGVPDGAIDPYVPTYWKATASRWGANNTPDKAIDADATTRWATGSVSAPGDWFTVDMGAVTLISGVTYDSGGGNDFPPAYKVELSSDCQHYTQAAQGAGVSGLTKVLFSNKQSARCFKITQTADTGTNWWSIYSISVQL
jgi:hypothetical protein